MTPFADDSRRRLIPRWRLVRDIPNSAELHGDPLERNSFRSDPRFLQEKIAEWQAENSLANAADAVACAIVTRKTHDVHDIARYLLDNRTALPEDVQNLAAHALSGKGQSTPPSDPVVGSIGLDNAINTARAIIHTRRVQLRQNPRNTLAWLDMSRGYASLGMWPQSVRTMNAALAIHPDHRLVLRSAARLFVHIGEPDRAHHTLLESARTTLDPWLLATEIAVASVREKTPKHMKRALRAISSERYTPGHLTELYSAIATVDLAEGHLRNARRRFRHSLETPTDNTVAQAHWAHRQMPALALPDSTAYIPRSYEAQCWRALEQKCWRRAMDECGRWLLDEPYSSRPANLGTFIGLSLVGDYRFSQIFAQIGLQAEPQNRTLRNNLTVALALQNKLEEAEHEFAQIEYSTGEGCPDYVYKATTGLLCFRRGDEFMGRSLYLKAESEAPKHMKAAVLIHRAREEHRLRTDCTNEVIAQAKELTDKSDQLFVHRLYEQHLGPAIATTRRSAD